jgi:L-asparagine oxygenase
MAQETIIEFDLTEAEVRQIRQEAACVADYFPDPGDPAMYDDHRFIDAGLPARLKTALEAFRRSESAAGLLIRGFPVDDRQIGPTPGHWDHQAVPKATLEPELFLGMCATALGQPFAFSTLQLGRIVQDILPIRGDEERQSGHGSTALLEFHTEDGFHPARCDYLLLFGLRNQDRVPTTLASIREVTLCDEDIEVLMRPAYHIVPDDEHIRQLQSRYPEHPAVSKMEDLRDSPQAVQVLFGERERPYLRIDLPFMRFAEDGPEVEGALHRLMAELDRVQRSVVVDQGSLLIIDNYLAVHGRRPFPVRYDGSDRWLKRMMVSRDLRKAAPLSQIVGSRVLF